jgi:hypothetical protein
MSKIAVIISNSVNLTTSIQAIRQYDNVPIAELKEKIAQKQAVYIPTLFQNDKEEVAKNLMGIINSCEALGDTIKLYEVWDDVDYDPEEEVDFKRISKEYLENILEENM